MKNARKAKTSGTTRGKAINGVIPDDVAASGTASNGAASKSQGKTYTVASGDSPSDSAKGGKGTNGTTTAAKCAVWTASYGGDKSLLIRSTSRGMVNYTALVVHEGRESREAEAYIKAWAKGGKAIGEYGSSDKALSRAYELCPQS